MQFPLSPVQQFILDCAELASTLDSLDTRDPRPHLRAVVLTCRAQYHVLLLRRQDLSPSIVEDGWLGFMLDSLLSRVRFLESRIGIHAPGVRKPPSSEVPPSFTG
jgi:hypothetical protein